MTFNRLYGYFTSTRSTRNVIAHYNITIPKGKTSSEPASLVVFIDNYFATHELLHFKAELITYPPESMNEGFIFMTRYQPEPHPWDMSPNRTDFVETDKDKEMKVWLMEAGLAENDFQWITVYDHRGLTSYNPTPQATNSIFIEFDSFEDNMKFMYASPEEKMRLYEAWLQSLEG